MPSPRRRIDIITIFPRMFTNVLGSSILKRAQRSRRVAIHLHDLRRYTQDRRRTVDDRPYGGGPGMILKPEPLFKAVEAITRRTRAYARGRHVILLAPQGQPLTQSLVERLAHYRQLILICGRYEGVDERVRQALVDREISIGDYVVTGGELPAMVVVDAVVRLLPGVIGHPQATHTESFRNGLLEYPQYTRPAVYRRRRVPTVLLTGDHVAIARWRQLQAVARTMTRRPDVLTMIPRGTS